MRDPYEVLGISRTASLEEAKQAFRSASKVLHPDNKETGDEAKFKEINAAYEEIKKRAGSAQGPSPHGPSFEEAFMHDRFWQDMGRFGFGPMGAGRARHRHVQMFSVSLTLEQAVAGGSRSLQDRNGKFDVVFPAGISPINPFSAMVDRGQMDVHIVFGVANHDRYTFADNYLDLYCIERVSAVGLMVGCKARIDTLHGPVDVSVPAMTQPGTVLRIAGKGYVHGYTYGDLLVQVEAKLPASITSSELAALAVL